MNMRKVRRLLCPALLMVAVFTSIVSLLNYDWVTEFHMEAWRVNFISHNNSFLHPQRSLRILRAIGKGSCFSWAKLVTAIAIDHKILYHQYVLGDNAMKDEYWHIVTVLIDASGDMWLQSNDRLERVPNLKEALVTAAHWMGRWPKGGHIREEFRGFKLKDTDLW